MTFSNSKKFSIISLSLFDIFFLSCLTGENCLNFRNTRTRRCLCVKVFFCGEFEFSMSFSRVFVSFEFVSSINSYDLVISLSFIRYIRFTIIYSSFTYRIVVAFSQDEAKLFVFTFSVRFHVYLKSWKKLRLTISWKLHKSNKFCKLLISLWQKLN